jgi:hypothetical protein
VAPATGARLWAEQQDGGIIAMGTEAPAGRSLLRVRLPREAELRVIHDGALLQEAHGAELDLGIAERGVYRVEARIGGRLWLLSNPIHLP